MMLDIQPEEVVAQISQPIYEIGRGWMLHPDTIARAGELGLPNENAVGFLVNGRAGVLGDGDASKPAAAIGFFAPDLVRQHWEARPATLSAIDASLHYRDAGAEWGRRSLASVSEADCDELTELCRKVADAAQPSIGALFAGWRHLDAPTDPRGAATIALNVLREMRGGAHLSAVYAAGIGPVGAIMAIDDPVLGGVTGAVRRGWEPPYPEPHIIARAHAEELTSHIVEAVIEVALTPAEGARLVDLVLLARDAMGE